MSYRPHSDRQQTFSNSIHHGRKLNNPMNKFQSQAKETIEHLPPVLNSSQIQRLKEHQYSSEGTTLLDPYLQHFWKWLVELFPLWMAPNLITIVGLMINILTSVLLMIFSNGAVEKVRRFLRMNIFSIRLFLNSNEL